MDFLRKSFIVPIVLAGLGIAFIFISLLVLLTKGKPSFIKKKLLIGGLIISLTSAAINASAGGTRTCYEPAPPPNSLYTYQLEYNAEDNLFVLNLTETNVLTVVIANIAGDEAYFELKDMQGNLITEGTLLPRDGEVNQSTFGSEEFEITLPDDLQEGQYNLYVFTMEATDEEKTRIQTDPEFILFSIIR
jgi:hypothetical protein